MCWQVQPLSPLVIRSSWTRRSKRWCHRASSRETLSASAFTPATPCVATKSADWRESVAHGLIFGGIHATLYPEEALERGHAHSVVKGDGDVVWSKVLQACAQGEPTRIYEGGKIDADQFVAARWDLLPPDKYMWASVQTVRGCPKHCSFCSVWRTDGQRPRQRPF